MEDWTRRANELTENLDIHRTSLTELRQHGGTGGTWRFTAMQMQWRHDVLAELVAGLQAFSNPDPKIGTIASVGERLAFATTVRFETLEKYDVEWDEAISSIANAGECLAYKGLRLRPQVGLVPIGQDPDSGLWEFAHIQTGEIPERTADGQLGLSEEMGIVFVLIPGGTFRMGAQKTDPKKPNYDKNAWSNEGPVHDVTLDPFFLSKYEMTQAQWERFVGRNPSLYGAHNYGENCDRTPAMKRRKLMGLHPVEQVSWEDCMDVLGRLGLALPTEAQWEFAARAGTNTVYWTGNEVESLEGAANLADSYAEKNGGGPAWKYEPGFDDGYTLHSPVGRFKASQFGLHDVHGNVWEWTRDGFHLGYSTPVREKDGARPLSGARDRVYRGGGFLNSASAARCALRVGYPPEFRYNFLGCRPSRSIDL